MSEREFFCYTCMAMHGPGACGHLEEPRKIGKHPALGMGFDVCGPQPQDTTWPRKVIMPDGREEVVRNPDGDFLPGEPWPPGHVPAEPPGVFYRDMHTGKVRRQDIMVGQGLGHKDNNPKHAAGIAKPQLNLVPGISIVLMAKVFELGAKKYGPFNWRDAAVARSIYIAAAHRHLLLMADGQDIDEESGQPHSAHVQCCMAIIQDAEALGMLVDDRPTPGKLADALARLTTKRQLAPDGAR